MHLNQLRKAKIYSFIDDESMVYTPKGTDAVKRALDKAEHFMFTAIPDADKEVDASVQAMKEAGVWKLPYSTCTFEFVGSLIPTGVKSNKDNELKLFGDEPGRVIILVAVEQAENRNGELVNMADTGYVRWIFTRHLYNKNEWLDLGAELPHTEVQRVFNAMLVTLHTRGVKRERWSGERKVLPNRPEPANAYTRVMIREAVAGGQGTAVAGDRHRVRLHLRRGHIRNQPYGAGRKSTRPQWIEPMLVGYDDEGVVEHETYMVKGRSRLT